jgi:hypothetical protein
LYIFRKLTIILRFSRLILAGHRHEASQRKYFMTDEDLINVRVIMEITGQKT